MTAEMQRILIPGAGYAGLCAASRLRRQLGKNSNCNITVMGRKKTFTQRIRLHQRSAGQAVAGFNLGAVLGRQAWLSRQAPLNVLISRRDASI